MIMNAMLPAIKVEKKATTAKVGRLLASASNSRTLYDCKSSPATSPSIPVPVAEASPSGYPSYTKSIYPELLDVYAFQKELLTLIIICVSGAKLPTIYLVLVFCLSSDAGSKGDFSNHFLYF